MKYQGKITLILIFIASFASVPADSQETYLLNYDDVDIRLVTQDIARFAKKTIILDPRVKGKVTIFSDSLLDEEQVWQVYLRTAQVNGFSTINEVILCELFRRMKPLETIMLQI